MDTKDAGTAYDRLFAYQKEDVDLICNRFGDVLLANVPGSGKSAEVIVSAVRLNAQRILVVCPASLRENWCREIRNWSEGYYRTKPLLNGRRVGKFLEDIRKPDAPPFAVILSYNHATQHAAYFADPDRPFDLLVLDEAHYLKNGASSRTKACLKVLWASATKRIAMTGTPLPNGRANEVYPLFAKLAPKTFGNYQKFVSRYCVKVESTIWVGGSKRLLITYPYSKNLEELGRLARERFMIRRSVKEVLEGQLPPLVRQYIPLTIPVGTMTQQARRLIESSMLFADEVVAAIEAGRVPIQRSSSVDEGDNAASAMSARRALGQLKAGPSADFVKELLDEDDSASVVVFAHHRDTMAALRASFDEGGLAYVFLDGATSPEGRQAAVDAFQTPTPENGNPRIFLASLLAANTGITLTRSSNVVIVEADWVPSSNEQAEGRCYRIGQQSITRVFYLVVPDSLDDAVTAAVLRKQRDITKMMEVPVATVAA